MGIGISHYKFRWKYGVFTILFILVMLSTFVPQMAFAVDPDNRPNTDVIVGLGNASYPWSFIVMGDPQPTPGDGAGGSDLFRATITVWNAMSPQPQFGIMIGDLTDTGATTDYTTASTGYLAEVDSCTMPLISGIGNHELRSSSGRANYINYFGDESFYWDYEGIRFIYFDNINPTDYAGHDYGAYDQCGMTAGNLSWIEDLLNDNYPTFVFMHIPMQEADWILNGTPGTYPFYCKDCAGMSAFEDLCETYDVRGVFYGHWHYWNFANQNGVPYVNAGHMREDVHCGASSTACREDYWPYELRQPCWSLITIEDANNAKIELYRYGNSDPSPIYTYYLYGAADPQDVDFSSAPAGYSYAQAIEILGTETATTGMQIPFTIYSDELVETGSWTVGGNTYTRRFPINVTENTGGNLTDYQIKFNIDTLTLEELGCFATDANGDEVEITDSDGTTQLYYWLPEYSHDKTQYGSNVQLGNFRSYNTEYWVKGNFTASATKNLYFYMNPSLGAGNTSSYFSGANTFLFFDDFNRADTAYSDADPVGNGWTHAADCYKIENHKLRVQAVNTTDNRKSLYQSHGVSSGTTILEVLIQGTYTVSGNELFTIYFSGSTAQKRSGMGQLYDDPWDYLNNTSPYWYTSGVTNAKNGTWYKLSMRYNFATDTVVYGTDSTYTASQNVYTGDTTTASTVYVGARGDSATQSSNDVYYIDHLYVRKYASTEPTVTPPTLLTDDAAKRDRIVLGLNNNCEDFPNDLRPYDLVGNALDYWIEDESADPIEGYVKVDDDLSSTQYVTWYYGNPSVHTTESTTSIFERYEDFESYSAGDTPSGNWTVATANGGTVTVQADPADAGNNVLRIVQGNTGITRGLLDLGTMGNGLMVDYKVRVAQTNKIWYSEFLGNGANTTLASEYYNALGAENKWVDSGSSQQSYLPSALADYDANTWYDTTVALVTEVNGFNFIKIASNILYKGDTRAAITSVDYWTPQRAATAETSGTFYVDDIIVRKYSWPCPRPLLADFEFNPNISVSPSSHNYGTVQPSTTYWARGSEPSWPLTDGNCTGNVTNSSSFAVDISFSMGNMTGGTQWTINSSPGSNQFRMRIYISGAGNSTVYTALSSTPQELISSLGDGTTEYFEFVLDTPTNNPFSDGVTKSGNITIYAEAS